MTTIKECLQTQQGHCPGELTLTGCTNLYKIEHNPSVIGGEAYAISPLTKELLAIESGWGNRSQFCHVCNPWEVAHASVDGPVPTHVKAVLRGSLQRAYEIRKEK